MIYIYEITTPSNTPETSKQKTVLQLEKGIIKRIDVFFPPGPAGLLKVQICQGIHQVFPKNTDGYFASEFETISYDDEYAILEPPYQLEAYTWNEDDTYDHMCQIRFLIVPVPGALRVSPPGVERIAKVEV